MTDQPPTIIYLVHFNPPMIFGKHSLTHTIRRALPGKSVDQDLARWAKPTVISYGWDQFRGIARPGLVSPMIKKYLKKHGRAGCVVTDIWECPDEDTADRLEKCLVKVGDRERICSVCHPGNNIGMEQFGFGQRIAKPDSRRPRKRTDWRSKIRTINEGRMAAGVATVSPVIDDVPRAPE
jgi:hypothetical protein